jgi:hypothetical protein
VYRGLNHIYVNGTPADRRDLLYKANSVVTILRAAATEDSLVAQLIQTMGRDASTPFNLAKEESNPPTNTQTYVGLWYPIRKLGVRHMYPPTEL